MPSREQLTDERVRELITELGDAGIIHEDEAGDLTATREFGEACEVRESTPDPPAVTRAKVSQPTHDEFADAYEAGDTAECVAILWNIVTGEDVRSEDQK